MTELIPDDIREFISQYIDSISQLEALLLLRRHPLVEWDAATTAKRIFADERETKEALNRLCADGLLACQSGFYSYARISASEDHVVGRLADFYGRYLVPVTNLIHSKPGKIRRFADAFKLRKDT